jgi:Uncharacterized protein conserved in bacteria
MRRSVSPRARGRLGALAATVATVLAVAGCDTAGGPGATPRPVPSTSADTVTVRDAWVKAADGGMTAAFGIIVNDTDTDVTVVDVRTTVSPVELHEMVMKDGAMVMQPKAGGITIRAGTRHVLEPGGDHLMLTDLSQPVRAGDELAFTLTLADGRSVGFTAVAKPFTGAQESYDPDPGMPMSHGQATAGSPAP